MTLAVVAGVRSATTCPPHAPPPLHPSSAKECPLSCALLRGTAALLFIVLVAPFTWRLITGDVLMTVESGSMTPTYRVGDVLLVQQPQGDELTVVGNPVVVAFPGSTSDHMYVHRVDEVTDDGAWLRGDANAARDPQPVTQADVVGTPRVVFSGLAADALALTLSPAGRIALAFVALVLLTITERRRVSAQLDDNTTPHPGEELT